MDLNARARTVFPLPGWPRRIDECFPAAAIVRALLADSRPYIEAIEVSLVGGSNGMRVGFSPWVGRIWILPWQNSVSCLSDSIG